MHRQVEFVRQAIHVPALGDRFQESPLMIWGLIPLSIKLSTKDTNGALFLFQHTDMGKGGPPRHIHHGQDEWFYVVEGEFVIEVGPASASERTELKSGDSFLAPRGIPHAWACVSDTPGTILTMVTPAGTFEDFILETTRHATVPSPKEVAAAFEAHDMTVVGAPLKVG